MQNLEKGGLIGDLSDMDMSPIPDYDRRVEKICSCAGKRQIHGSVPGDLPFQGIPVQETLEVREGRIDEAVDMALAYSPFPATVCGYLAPTLAWEHAPRQTQEWPG